MFLILTTKLLASSKGPRRSGAPPWRRRDQKASGERAEKEDRKGSVPGGGGWQSGGKHGVGW